MSRWSKKYSAMTFKSLLMLYYYAPFHSYFGFNVCAVSVGDIIEKRWVDLWFKRRSLNCWADRMGNPSWDPSNLWRWRMKSLAAGWRKEVRMFLFQMCCECMCTQTLRCQLASWLLLLACFRSKLLQNLPKTRLFIYLY